MNPIVRRFIKTAIVFLIIGLCLGAYVLVRRELFDIWPSRFLLSAHTHAVFVGFVMCMILGVALWLFPKPLGKDRQVAQRLVELCYWLLTLGTGARVIGELARSGSDGMSLKWLVVVAGLCQVVGLMAYSWAMWKRVRPQRRFLRQRNDEGYGREAIHMNIDADLEDQAKNFRLFDESLSIMKKAWSQELFDHQGEFYTYPAPGFGSTI